jgi:hypothetical protein
MTISLSSSSGSFMLPLLLSASLRSNVLAASSVLRVPGEVRS